MDRERTTLSCEAMIHLAMIRLMLNRLFRRGKTKCFDTVLVLASDRPINAATNASRKNNLLTIGRPSPSGIAHVAALGKMSLYPWRRLPAITN